MAILAMSAMMVRRSYSDDEGHRHLIDPVTPIAVPQALKATLADKGQIAFQLPETAVVVVLVGGQEGQPYTVSSAITYPNGDTSSAKVQHFTWGKHPSTTLSIQMENSHLGFDRVGVYEVKLLVDGQPVAVLPLPAHWEGEPLP